MSIFANLTSKFGCPFHMRKFSLLDVYDFDALKECPELIFVKNSSLASTYILVNSCKISEHIQVLQDLTG